MELTSEKLRLIVSFKDLVKEIEGKIKEGDFLLSFPVKSQSDLEELTSKVKSWSDESLLIFQRAFNSPKNRFEKDLYEAYPRVYNFPGKRRDIEYSTSIQKQIIQEKKLALFGNLRIISVSDAVTQPNKIDLGERINFSVNDKLMLILSKLYELNDEYYYPINEILLGNGIESKRMNEDRELIQMLEDKDLISTNPGPKGEKCAQITSNGIMFYEENLKPKPVIKKQREKQEIKVFLSHGGSHLWKDVARFITKEFGFGTISLQEQKNAGRTIIEKLEQETKDCDFAIIVMTAEDEQSDGNKRARQNVIHEIGFCQGVFGRRNVLVLKQAGVEGFTNISGLVYEEFTENNIKSTFEKIRQELSELKGLYEVHEKDL